MIQRIPIDDASDNVIVRKFTNEAFLTALKLEAELFDWVQESDPNTHLNNSILGPNIQNTTLHPTVASSST